MQIEWESFKAMSLCHFKAWNIAQEKNTYVEFSIDENIINLHLPVNDISLHDKIAALAWFHSRDDFQKNEIDRIRICTGNYSEIIRLPKPNAKAKKLLGDAKIILDNNEPPAFHKNPHCNECHLRESCLKKLKERDCISLLGGMTTARISKFHKKGIFTILQLSHLFKPRRRNRKLHSSENYPFELKALAIREKKTFVLHKPELNEAPVSIYLDMEGLPDKNFIYLISGIIKCDNKEDETFSFWADSKDQEEKIFENLFDVLLKNPGANIFHYGSYEAKAIKQIDKQKFAMIESRMINLLSFFRTHIYPPTYGNGLKEVANYIGFHWSDPDANGLLSIKWRNNWELTGMDIWKEKLIQYNVDDCRALISVESWMKNLASGSVTEMQEVAKMKRHSPYGFSRNLEYGEDFNNITKAAYFDYQQDKIYWRGKDNKRKRKDEPKGHGRGQVTWQPKKVNEIRMIPRLNECPHCGCRKIYHSQTKRTFKQTDLKFTAKGIRQWIIEYHSGKGTCSRCRMKHNDSTLRMLHYGDNLMAWGVNMYVNYRISHEKISRMLWEQFRVWANKLYFMERKEKWFRQFHPEIDYLWETIKKSPVIHIDETTVKLNKDNGYVWVFATAHTVTYHYTANREADFLNEKLKGYEGIIVTDFYGGYEPLPFKRQKCLVHLLRDLNDDLFKNPFDEEFKLLVSSFGRLLKNIVATIDKYGLKKRNLKKHIKETIAFQKQFLQKKNGSEIYGKYTKRLRKHWDELWVFLYHDDVPWNNNNAEAGVKAFAMHRRSTNGRMSERLLHEYLKMLSLSQTCRYRNVSFLDYLRRKATVWQNVPSAILPGYVPPEQQKLFAKKMNFKSAKEWQEWNQSGKRPLFISPDYFFIKQNT